jgi:DNA polymerase (family X)
MTDVPNAEIAAVLDELGDLYELDGAVVHRVVAYRTAAKTVREATVSVAALAREGKATDLPGIGKTLQEKIVDLIETGTVPAAEKLRAKFPAGLVEMTKLPGLGPKRARKLFDELGIDSLDALRTAAETEQLRDVRGFGEKFEQSVIAALDAGAAGQASVRMPLYQALPVADAIIEALRAHPASDRVELAGSARRMVDSVKDLDIIATASDPKALLGAFAQLDAFETCSKPGDNAAKARTHNGLAVDLRVVAPEQFGNLLQHFTGSRAHNMALRERAVRRGLHVSEYGILDDADGVTHKFATEEEVYGHLGMPYIPPEMREDRGELDLTEIPPLIEWSDLKGDLHCHTVASDGKYTIEEMAHAARDRGLEYLAITDHSASHGFGDDVQPDELRRQIERVRAVDETLEGFHLLIGTEVNILPDGSVDYADDVLAELDWVIASVHTSFGMPSEAMTARLVAACEHPLVDAIGHPTGRKIEARRPYALDVGAVIEAAARTGTMIEINSAPDRRDLDDINARAAQQGGVRILIDSDAHRTDTLASTRWGIATARRAWLTAADVANTLPWSQFAPLRKRAGGGQPSKAGKSSAATTASTASGRKGASAASARSR